MTEGMIEKEETQYKASMLVWEVSATDFCGDHFFVLYACLIDMYVYIYIYIYILQFFLVIFLEFVEIDSIGTC